MERLSPPGVSVAAPPSPSLRGASRSVSLAVSAALARKAAYSALRDSGEGRWESSNSSPLRAPVDSAHSRGRRAEILRAGLRVAPLSTAAHALCSFPVVGPRAGGAISVRRVVRWRPRADTGPHSLRRWLQVSRRPAPHWLASGIGGHVRYAPLGELTLISCSAQVELLKMANSSLMLGRLGSCWIFVRWLPGMPSTDWPTRVRDRAICSFRRVSAIPKAPGLLVLGPSSIRKAGLLRRTHGVPPPRSNELARARVGPWVKPSGPCRLRILGRPWRPSPGDLGAPIFRNTVGKRGSPGAMMAALSTATTRLPRGL